VELGDTENIKSVSPTVVGIYTVDPDVLKFILKTVAPQNPKLPPQDPWSSPLSSCAPPPLGIAAVDEICSIVAAVADPHQVRVRIRPPLRLTF
jgi:hypothetical protein